jgi:hypothetical protein
MCTFFLDKILYADILNQSVSQSIVLLNFILRVIVIWFVKLLAYITHSERTLHIMVIVFVVQFFNTDLLLLILNADFTDT